MTDQSFPITPSPKLRAYWRRDAPNYRDCGGAREDWLMDRAAGWGRDQQGTINEAMLQARADQELEACLKHLLQRGFSDADILCLRIARRPKPPSEADQALAALEADPKDGAMIMIDSKQFSIIHRALQRLKDLEAVPND